MGIDKVGIDKVGIDEVGITRKFCLVSSSELSALTRLAACSRCALDAI